MEVGRMENKMERVKQFIRMELKSMVFGKMVKELNRRNNQPILNNNSLMIMCKYRIKIKWKKSCYFKMKSEVYNFFNNIFYNLINWRKILYI